MSESTEKSDYLETRYKAPQAEKGKVQEGESLLQKSGEPLPAPHWVYAAIFFLGGAAFLAEGFASLMTVGFGFFPVAFLGSGGTKAASA